MTNKLIIPALIAFGGLLGACASPKLPVPEQNPPVVVVQQNVDAYKDHYVTWGGVILATDTKPALSEIIIMSKPLTQSTRPIEQDEILGRFIAQSSQFLDPALYAQNREITIYGRITHRETRKVGEFEYDYPVVAIESLYLWPPRAEYVPYYDSWYYPWYGPWYYPYPYYPHHHRP